MTQELSKPTCIEYGVAVKPLAGEPFCGDAYLVRMLNDDLLLAVIDGIGHGRQAARAADVALAVLEKHLAEPLEELIERCHRALTNERGVAMSVMSIQPERNLVNWLGVGNVWGGLIVAGVHRNERWKSMPLHRGIVGDRLPRLRAREVAIAPGDWLVLATDGVRADFDGEIAMNGPPRAVASRILTRHFKGNDDALVLAASYQGRGCYE